MTFLPSIPNLLATAAEGPVGGGFWMPRQASPIADVVDDIFFFILWISVFFFVLIVALMVLFVIKYRRREGQERQPSASHNTVLEVTWTIIPLILVIIIFYVGLRGYVGMVQEPLNAYEVWVTGQRWFWSFEHANGAVQSDRLTVPAGRPVKLKMTSTDVIHSFYIPDFRLKKDVVPGRYTYLWFEAPEPGQYQLFCAEYCGAQHSQMTGIIEVVPADQFEDIITQKANWIDDYADEDLARAGLRLYPRCQSCHTLDGSRLQGPSFRETHRLWGQQRVLDDGSEVTVDENYVRNSIINPASQIVMNYPNVMPTFQGQLKEREVRALIEFIRKLDEVVDESGNPIE
ncbi:MAG: cytochrome c oxidase subunit II [Planctomycetota bacterium]|nr:cytochrome c oxidase subunit II [Planctomycetota bacterium]